MGNASFSWVLTLSSVSGADSKQISGSNLGVQAMEPDGPTSFLLLSSPHCLPLSSSDSPSTKSDHKCSESTGNQLGWEIILKYYQQGKCQSGEAWRKGRRWCLGEESLDPGGPVVPFMGTTRGGQGQRAA